MWQELCFVKAQTWIFARASSARSSQTGCCPYKNRAFEVTLCQRSCRCTNLKRFVCIKMAFCIHFAKFCVFIFWNACFCSLIAFWDVRNFRPDFWAVSNLVAIWCPFFGGSRFCLAVVVFSLLVFWCYGCCMFCCCLFCCCFCFIVVCCVLLLCVVAAVAVIFPFFSFLPFFFYILLLLFPRQWSRWRKWKRGREKRGEQQEEQEDK